MNAEDPQLQKSVADAWPVVWPLLGGIGGAIISLGLPWHENLSGKRKAFTVLIGVLLAVFLGPLVVRYALGATTRGDSEIVGAIYCVVGIAGSSVMARVVRWMQRRVDRLPVAELPSAGDPE